MCILDVYTLTGGLKMATAKVFKSGNSQAVRLPKEFRVNSKEVEISRRGDEIVLRERKGTMARAFDLLAALPADLTLAGRTRTSRRSARGCDGAALPAGYEHLYLHPAEKAGGGAPTISHAQSRRSGALRNYVWGIDVRGGEKRAAGGGARTVAGVGARASGDGIA